MSAKVGTAIGGKPAQYFEEKKKGEMNELKNALNGVINDNDSKKGREVIRKVIGYMTLGMDASPVFSEMCRASFTNDEVMKKMIYFYLTTYAEDNPDLAIMAVNTFKKDCKHSSSKIRGLALRNLCSFKSSDYVNNVLPVVRELLNDFEPYVKKTAIMGVLKVFYVDPATIILDDGIINSLSQLIKDSDGLVSVNALLALDEILVSEGGVPLNNKLYFYLINRLKEYNEWQQTCILDILYRYTPDKNNDKQRYEIMGVLWEKLKHSSTPLVLGSIKIILKLTERKEQMFRSIVEKIKAPLITLMSGNQNSGSYETMYVVLQHIEYVILHMGGKQYFEKDFKYFYCKFDEPSYIKGLKVKILGELANEYNLGDLLNELNDYASDVDIEMARKSVKILTDIALRLPEVSKALLININSFYKLSKPHLTNEAMLSFYQILRRYPKLFLDIRSSLLEYRNDINQPESTKALIWLLGTFAQQLDEAPYILEEFVENEQKFTSFDNSIKEVLLTSILQTFLKRPVQTHKILSLTFKLIFESDKSSLSLIDHASFYYQALENSVEEVKKNFSTLESEMTKFKEELPEAYLDEDFNSLGILYKQKEGKYTKPYEYFIAMRNKQLGLQPEVEEEEESEEEKLNEQQPETQGEAVYESIEAGDLEANLVLHSQEFERIWGQLEQGTTLTFQTQNEDSINEQSIQELFKMWNITTMASAEEQDSGVLKFYLYAKDTRSGNYFCLEMHIDKAEQSIMLATKSKDEHSAALLNAYIQEFLSLNELIR